MAQPQRRRQERENILNLQIPQKAGQASGGLGAPIQIPNGYQFELNGVKISITSTVTPERQMINLGIDLESLMPKRR